MSNNRRRQNSAAAPFFVYTPGVAVPRNATHILVHPSVNVLPNRVFEDCKHLKEVVLPVGLLKIGEWAFYRCRSLEFINLPSTLIKIGRNAFWHCTSLKRLDFPEGLTVIADYAFCDCCSLERISLPSTLPRTGDDVFTDCTLLKLVTLVDGIQSIGCDTFDSCDMLEDILLPATLTAIGQYAFNRCKALRMVKLCGGIQMIEEDAFDGCNSLDHVRVSSKALVITKAEGERHFHLATDGTVPLTNYYSQVVIASECFNSMRPADISEVEQAIAKILERRLEWDDARGLLHDLLAPYKVRHQKECTTLLELGLWKAKTGEANHANPGVREACWVSCGAEIIIPNVWSFL